MELIGDQNVREKLKSFRFLQGVSEHTVRRLAESSVVLRYSPGDYLWFQGMPASLVAVLWEGGVQLSLEQLPGPLREIALGQIVGTEVLTGSSTYETTAICLEPSTIVATPLQLVLECMGTDEHLRRNIAESLVDSPLLASEG